MNSSGTKPNALQNADREMRKLLINHVLDDDISRDGSIEVGKSWEINIEVNDPQVPRRGQDFELFL
tara:strand:+ start:1263 stop:1460 length:198 start_codon:yes stop_codon:yes gene_type:complete